MLGHRRETRLTIKDDESVSGGLMDKLKDLLMTRAASFINHGPDKLPSVLNIVADSIEIMQQRIMRSRMAGDPPEILIAPDPGDIGFLEFHRAGEAIAAGRRAVEQQHEQLKELTEVLGR